MQFSKPVIELPEYKAFVRRYANDCLRFVIEVLGQEPTWQQIQLYEEVSHIGCRVSVGSGRGTGKTRAFGNIGLWHFLCHYSDQNKGSETVFSAPKIEQVRKNSWREMSVAITDLKRGPYKWLARYIRWGKTVISMRGFEATWFIHAKTAPRGEAEKVSGSHADWLMILNDEGSGMEDAVLETFQNTCTDERNRMVIASQMSKNSGFMWDTHFKTCINAGGPWVPLVFNSEESPLVGLHSLKEALQKYGGRNTDAYRVNILGLPPEKGEGYLSSRQDIERVFSYGPIMQAHHDFGWMISMDIAEGDGNRDKSVVVIAKVWGMDEYGANARRVEVHAVYVFSEMSPTQVRFFAQNEAKRLPDPSFLIDAIGIGATPYKDLVEDGSYAVQAVKWGRPCIMASARKDYANQRAEACIGAHRAIVERRLSILDPTHKAIIVNEGSRIPRKFKDNGIQYIVPKEEMKASGLKSPDVWDAICQLFIGGYAYTPCYEGIAGLNSSKLAGQSIMDIAV